MISLDDLFAAIRDAAEKPVWSKGVTLARSDVVTGDFANDEELVLRVQDDARAVSPEVHLYPKGEDWHCDCGSDDDPCHHVVAAAIATRTAQKEGKPLPKSKSAPGRLVYRLYREGKNLSFVRLIEDYGKTEPLTQSLSSGRVPVAATKIDMSIDISLAGGKGALPAATWQKVIPYLMECELTLDDRPIKFSRDGMGVLAVIDDEGPGVQLTAKQDPRIDEMFENGVARAGNVLHLIRIPKVPERERKILTEGRYFAPTEFGLLASEVLPKIKDQVRLEIRTHRLPGHTFAKPRLMLDVEQDGTAMLVKAQIVYGDPPVARVMQGRLVSIGDKAPTRDEDAERTLRDELSRTLELSLDEITTADGAKALVLADKLRRWEGEVRGPLDAFQVDQPLSPTWIVDDQNIAFHFTGHHRGQSIEVEPRSVLRAWRKGENLFPIPGGGFAPLPRDWLTRFGARVLAFLDQKKAAGDIPKSAALFVANLLEDDDVAPPPSLNQLRDVLSNCHDQDLPLPDLSSVNAALRTYQLDGVKWLHVLQQAGLGAMLADDMGLGKTLQAICILQRQTLVVAPTSLLSNWQREIRRFRPHLSVHIYHGAGRELDPEADVTITTYAVMRRDIEELAAKRWQTIILDEAQTIKNPESLAAQAAQRLQGDFRVCLTGTPLENHLDDIWSQFHFLNPGLLGTRQGFTNNYTKVIKRDPEAIGVLRDKLAPFILRRLKKDVAADLPERIDQVLYVDLSDEERDQYDAILAATKQEVRDRLGATASVFEILEALLRLRQACCHTGLLPGVENGTSAKLSLLRDRLTEGKENGSRALVFSQWTSLLDLVKAEITPAGLSHLTLTGETRNRGEIVDAFQNGESDLLLMTLKAGGVGLNLTAADHVYILDPWWNPAAEDQAADRAHRIGQTHTVMVHKLVATQTIEENIIALQERKRELAGGLLDARASAGAMTREELLSLLQ